MGHRSWMILTMMLAMFKTFFLLSDVVRNASFDENYDVTWGNDRVLFLNQGQVVQLSLDQASGFSFQQIMFLPGRKFFCTFVVSLYLDSTFSFFSLTNHIIFVTTMLRCFFINKFYPNIYGVIIQHLHVCMQACMEASFFFF